MSVGISVRRPGIGLQGDIIYFWTKTAMSGNIHPRFSIKTKLYDSLSAHPGATGQVKYHRQFFIRNLCFADNDYFLFGNLVMFTDGKVKTFKPVPIE